MLLSSLGPDTVGCLAGHLCALSLSEVGKTKLTLRRLGVELAAFGGVNSIGGLARVALASD